MKRIAIRNSVLLTLGMCLHTLLCIAGADPQGAFGPADTLSGPGLVSLAVYAVLIVLLYSLPALSGRQPGMIARGTAALAPMPLYLLSFPSDWFLCLIGICTCLALGHYLLLAHPEQSVPVSLPAGISAPPAGVHPASVDLVILSTLGLLIMVLLVSGHRVTGHALALWGVALYAALTTLSSLVIEYRSARVTAGRLAYAEQILLGLAVSAALAPGWRELALPLAGCRQAVALGRLWHRERGGGRLWQHLTQRPARLLVVSFAVAIGVGALLLDLPVVSAAPGRLGALDALFTATSAVCVTGLIVVDTGADLSALGQLLVLGMIQVGGLGIMTVSMFLALLLGRNVGLQNEFALGEMIGEERRRLVLRLVRFIILIAVAIEAVGGLTLALAFHGLGLGWARSFWYGAFHSVSAFCNAGFALFSDSFCTYSGISLVVLTLSALIILGGVGFGVLFSLLRLGGSRRHGLVLHVRLVLILTVTLCVAGAALFWVFERDGVLAGMSPGAAAVNAWFQSVTTRTAGFNTVDVGALNPATDLLVRILMFIGAAPGSTGGGIKITTFAVVLLLMRSILLGRDDVVAGGRRIDPETVSNAAALLCVSLGVLLSAIVVLQATQAHLAPGALAFEAVSALGTVGLSHGITAQLTPLGKVIIIVLMFAGRVGPLSLLIMMRPRRRSTLDYPSTKVMVG